MITLTRGGGAAEEGLPIGALMGFQYERDRERTGRDGSGGDEGPLR